uniref:Ribonuclease A-domain domain-containing protein n=1 Tax=Pelusios castaneus TaxID=367368 RepID=A0A8C8RXM6_9SAUR
MAKVLRGPRPLLLLPLLLLAAGMAQLSQGASYQDFVNKHIDFPKTSIPNGQHYCNILMRRRGLTYPVCKYTNTFIHAPISPVRAVCSNRGRCYGRNLCNSKAAFRLTTCRLSPSSRPGRCRYRARVQIRRIQVRCNWWRLPNIAKLFSGIRE